MLLSSNLEMVRKLEAVEAQVGTSYVRVLGAGMHGLVSSADMDRGKRNLGS